jgi:hypothetical protein
VALDPETGLVVPSPAPGLRVPDDALARLAVLAGGPQEDDRLEITEPVRADAVVSVGLGAEALLPLSPGVAAYRLTSHVLNLHRLGGAALDACVAAVAGAATFEVRAATPRETLDALLQVARETPREAGAEAVL